MADIPPYDLDPFALIRNPDALPVLFRRGVFDLVARVRRVETRWAKNNRKPGKRREQPKRPKRARGTLEGQLVQAFNIIAHSLTESGRLKRGTLELTSAGVKREAEVKRAPDNDEKMVWISRWTRSLRERYPGRYDGTWQASRSAPEVT